MCRGQQFHTNASVERRRVSRYEDTFRGTRERERRGNYIVPPAGLTFFPYYITQLPEEERRERHDSLKNRQKREAI
jgi:hypothetical protein